MTTSTLITISPVSTVYFKKYESKYVQSGVNQNFDLPALRRMPIRQLIKLLRSIKSEHLYAGYEEAYSAGLNSILCIIAFFTRAKRISVLDQDLVAKRFYRIYIFDAILKLIWGTVVSHLNLFICRLELKELVKKERKRLSYHGDTVLYLKTNLWFGIQVGGSIGHISGVVNAFIKTGFKINYYSMEPPIMLDPQVNIQSIPVFKTFGLPQETNLYTFQRKIVFFFKRQDKLSRPSFIYSRMAISNYANVILSRMLNVPLILEYNGSEVWVSEKWGSGIRHRNTAQMAEDVCLKHAHVIVVVSDVLKQELISRGIDAERILFYPNCIEPEIFNPARFTNSEKSALRTHYNLTDAHKVFTFVGTFGQWHGAEKFAAAIKNLCANNSDWLRQHNVHFLLIGDGLKMPEVKALISNNTCKPFVTIAGLIPQKDAPLHLAASDILMSPHVSNLDGSKFFGSPTKLFEYMAMGKGIIASDLDQIGEVLKKSLKIDRLPKENPAEGEDRLALLVEPGSVSDLEKAIIFMAENLGWAAVLGKNARKEALEKYTWEKHVSEIMDAFHKNVDKLKVD